MSDKEITIIACHASNGVNSRDIFQRFYDNPDLSRDFMLTRLNTQGESVNILLNFREFLQASCEHSVQIVTAHRRYFLLASDARFA